MKRFGLTLVLVVLLMPSITMPLRAAAPEVWVCPTGSCGNPGSEFASIQEALTAVDSGGKVHIAAGNYPGGLTVDKSVIFVGEPGAVVGHGSPGVTIAADDVTLSDLTLDGNGAAPADSGIVINDGVERLWIRRCEVMGWPQDGLHFDGAIMDLRVVDGYIHDNTLDGIAFAAAPEGLVQIMGNAFRANGGLGISLPTGNVAAEYNAWGSYDGPIGNGGDGASDSVDYTPWVYGSVYADVLPSSAQMRETENVVVDIMADARELYGAQFSVAFDPAMLEVIDTTADGSGYFQGSQAARVTYDNSTGTLDFRCARQAPDAPLSAIGLKLLSITFRTKEISVASVNALVDLGSASVKLSTIEGLCINVDSVTDGNLTILGTTTVGGQVDLQGRDNDADALVAFPAGILYPATMCTSDSWGRYTFADVTDGVYVVTVTMARHLPASKSFTVEGEAMSLLTVKLLSGDVDGSGAIEVLDLARIGNRFNEIVDPATTTEDVNYDGRIDILDLVVTSGNYGMTASPW